MRLRSFLGNRSFVSLGARALNLVRSSLPETRCPRLSFSPLMSCIVVRCFWLHLLKPPLLASFQPPSSSGEKIALFKPLALFSNLNSRILEWLSAPIFAFQLLSTAAKETMTLCLRKQIQGFSNLCKHPSATAATCLSVFRRRRIL